MNEQKEKFMKLYNAYLKEPKILHATMVGMIMCASYLGVISEAYKEELLAEVEKRKS